MAEKKVSLRRCTGCGQMMPKKELLRVVCGEGRFELDTTGKKSGRGAYICRSEDCLNRAQKSRGFERSFKAAVPKEIYESLRREMGVADD